MNTLVRREGWGGRGLTVKNACETMMLADVIRQEKQEDVEWRKLHNKDFYRLYHWPNVLLLNIIIALMECLCNKFYIAFLNVIFQ